MIDEKHSPPAYVPPPQQPQGQMSYTPPAHPPPAQSYPPQGSYGTPPGAPSPQQSQPANTYFANPQTGTSGGMSGYPSSTQTPMMAMNAGQQYQQQLFAMCAAGNHDVTTKYGIAGIITAILCFPCGLICLFADTEKRCARCGSRIG